jgi:predicted nucleic-acid-binding Zn-ribbon protein
MCGITVLEESFMKRLYSPNFMDRQKIENFIHKKKIKCPQCGHDKFEIKVHAKSILNLDEDQHNIQGVGDKALMLSCKECYFMSLYDLTKIVRK